MHIITLLFTKPYPILPFRLLLQRWTAVWCFRSIFIIFYIIMLQVSLCSWDTHGRGPFTMETSLLTFLALLLTGLQYKNAPRVHYIINDSHTPGLFMSLSSILVSIVLQLSLILITTIRNICNSVVQFKCCCSEEWKPGKERLERLRTYKHRTWTPTGWKYKKNRHDGRASN